MRTTSPARRTVLAAGALLAALGLTAGAAVAGWGQRDQVGRVHDAAQLAAGDLANALSTGLRAVVGALSEPAPQPSPLPMRPAGGVELAITLFGGAIVTVAVILIVVAVARTSSRGGRGGGGY